MRMKKAVYVCFFIMLFGPIMRDVVNNQEVYELLMDANLFVLLCCEMVLGVNWLKTHISFEKEERE